MNRSVRAALCALALAAVTAAAANAPQPALEPAMARAAIDYVYLCADCHGGIGEGHPAGAVRPLAGRPARDLEQRLTQLRHGDDPPGIPSHAQVLSKLSAQELGAIADYLSTLVAPPVIAAH